MRFRGTMILEVEYGTSEDLKALVPALQAGLDHARQEFPEVVGAEAKRDRKQPWITITVLIETPVPPGDETFELDDVADALMRRALEWLAEQSADTDDVVVLESALTPA